PGLQYHSTINDWHTCPASGPIIASNPCSEYMFLDDTACNLASLNLLAFTSPSPAGGGSDGEAVRGGVLTSGAVTRTPAGGGMDFDVEGYEHAVRLWTIVLEISVLMAQFPSR